jgi:DNA (cytosine-5)-methyltransferase 1
MTKPVIFSFFSGAGFLDLGFEKNGFNVAFVNEIHVPFVDAYRYSRQQMGMSEPSLGYFVDDIDLFLTDSGQAELRSMVESKKREGSLVGFIGGPPCPDFSVGGKNKGRAGENGRLSKSYVDLICQANPSFFLFENVKGLWRTKRHREFYDELKQQLADAGYILTDRLVNAIEYGAPQDRDRIILIGVKRNLLKNQQLSSAAFTKAICWESELKFPGRTAFTDFPWASTDGSSEMDNTTYKSVPKELTVTYWFNKNKVSSHPNANDAFMARAGLAKFKSVVEGDVSKKSYKRLHRYRYSPTAAYGNNEVHIHPTEPRRITVAEALAIQSLPAEFCLPPKMTLTNKFKTIGNGVPYLAAAGLAKTLNQFIQEHLHETHGSELGESHHQTSQATVVRLHQRTIWDEGAGRQRRAA